MGEFAEDAYSDDNSDDKTLTFAWLPLDVFLQDKCSELPAGFREGGR